ncbi:glycosyltransferase family 2 protein [Weeksellaceae bacterium A-14]
MKISVCLATYNGERYIKGQVNSILSQLRTNDELIVSDDSSTDKTVEILKNINDHRIKIYINQGRSGISHNFENALSHVSGDYIFLSDQDDIWMDNKVSKMIQALQNFDCVIHNAQVIDDKGDFLGADLFSIYRTRTGYFRNLLRNTYVGCCMAFRKSLLTYVLPIPLPVTMHDMWIGLISEKKGTTAIIEDSLILYRRHGNNASSTSQKSNFSRYYQLKYRLIMLYYTLIR